MAFNGVVVDWNGKQSHLTSSVRLYFRLSKPGMLGHSTHRRGTTDTNGVSFRSAAILNRFPFRWNLHVHLPSAEVDSFDLTVKAQGAQGQIRLGRSYWSDEESKSHPP